MPANSISTEMESDDLTYTCIKFISRCIKPRILQDTYTLSLGNDVHELGLQKIQNYNADWVQPDLVDGTAPRTHGRSPDPLSPEIKGFRLI